MYEFAYNEIVEESSRSMRAQEARALDRVISMLCEAQAAGPKSRQGISALYQLRTLWTVFLDDLTGTENGLPPSLRAGLVSIGIWVIKEIERLRGGDACDLAPLIEINQIIRDGLH
ncbi:MAG TPA: flagellar biosynthesis regulator FlaF [Roseiarcus sp.]|nr:flagellar biosynthesis regulator FlaF [Roseiarcus sp.]